MFETAAVSSGTPNLNTRPYNVGGGGKWWYTWVVSQSVVLREMDRQMGQRMPLCTTGLWSRGHSRTISVELPP